MTEPTRPYLVRQINDGWQFLYWFDNDYGASVVQGPYTYGGPEGKWELGVIKWKNNDYALTYDTPITDDVIGYLSDDQVEELLQRIKEL